MKQGWTIKSLDDVTCTISNGNSINAKRKKEKYTNISDGVPYIGTKDIGFNSSINYANGVKIPLSDTDSFRVAREGSVLICSEGGSAGKKIGLINQDVCFGNKLFRLTPCKEVESKYLFYWCQSNTFKKEFRSRLSGLIGGVSKKKFLTIPIPLPPNQIEQKDIANKIDHYFEKVKQIQINIERKRGNIDHIFQSYLDRVFGVSAINSSENEMLECELKDILEFQPRNGWSPSSSFDSQKGIPVLKLSAITGFNFKSSKVKHTSSPVNESAHYWIQDNDLLVTRSNTIDLVGHIAICNNITTPTIYSDLIMKMRVNSSLVLTKFIYYQMRSTDTRRIIKQGARGASSTMQKIKKSLLQKLPVCIPKSKKTQQGMIDRFDRFSEEVNLVSDNYYKQLNHIKEFKKAILQKAFEGEL